MVDNGESWMDYGSEGADKHQAALRHEFIDAFIAETQKDIVELYASLDRGDVSHINLLVHRLRGRARMMSFTQFEDVCSRIEGFGSGEANAMFKAEFMKIQIELDSITG